MKEAHVYHLCPSPHSLKLSPLSHDHRRKLKLVNRGCTLLLSSFLTTMNQSSAFSLQMKPYSVHQSAFGQHTWRKNWCCVSVSKGVQFTFFQSIAVGSKLYKNTLIPETHRRVCWRSRRKVASRIRSQKQRENPEVPKPEMVWFPKMLCDHIISTNKIKNKWKPRWSQMCTLINVKLSHKVFIGGLQKECAKGMWVRNVFLLESCLAIKM